MKTALVITHEKHEGPGQFGEILAAHGFHIQTIYTRTQDISAYKPDAYNLVLVMGGPMGVYETDQYPFLKDEMEFLKSRMKLDLPTLGVCLGAQLIAGALDAKVFKGSAGQEIGWSALELEENTQSHALRHLSGDKTSMFHWHGDTFDLPEGAVLRASTSLYENQAFSYKRNTLALQFHPEMTADMIQDWATTLGPDMGGSKITGSHDELRSQTEKNIATLSTQAKLFFEEWLQSVGFHR